MRIITYIASALGAIPLIAYPIYFPIATDLLADSRYADGQPSPGVVVMACAFSVGLLAYPLGYAASIFWAYRKIKTGNEGAALKAVCIPLCYLFMLAMVFLTWMKTESDPRNSKSKELANHALEPTALAVVIPATQEFMPAVIVARL